MANLKESDMSREQRPIRQENSPAHEEEKLPFDIRTLLTGLRLRIKLFIGVVLVFTNLALILGYSAGTRIYEA